jgi:hypothetical protein
MSVLHVAGQVIFACSLLLRLERVAGPNYRGKQLIVLGVVLHLCRRRIQMPPNAPQKYGGQQQTKISKFALPKLKRKFM